MSHAPQCRTALYLVCKIIGTEAVSSKSKPLLYLTYQKVCACVKFKMMYCLVIALFTYLMD